MSVITVGLPEGYQVVYREDTHWSTVKNPALVTVRAQRGFAALRTG